MFRKLYANPKEIIEKLREDLLKEGKERFNQIIILEDDLQFTCPKHAGGQERRASCGMTTRNKSGTRAGIIHCFACGYVSDLETMIGECFEKENPKSFGKRWLLRNFAFIADGRQGLEIDFTRGKEKEVVKEIKIDRLDALRYYPDYFKKRGIGKKVIEEYGLKVDNENIIIPLKNKRGQIIGIMTRSLKGKFYNLPEKTNKIIYGLHEALKNKIFTECIITEGVFDVLTAAQNGKKAIGLLGTGTRGQIEELNKLPFRKYILAMDNDGAGRRATEKLKKELSKNKIITQYELPPKRKDLNELSSKDFKRLKEYF